MSTRPRKKITTTTSYKRKKKTDLAIPFFRVGNFWNKKVKKKTRTVGQCKFRTLSRVVFIWLPPPPCPSTDTILQSHPGCCSRLIPFFFFCFSFERWMLARHTLLLLLLLLCEDLMYSNERAAASARLFSGVPIILG
jgi:hypothetical protein